jgi:purine-binding chemotaxis protein CheW
MSSNIAQLNTIRFVRCRVGEETYALDMNWVRSIHRTEALRWNTDGDVPAGWLSGGEGGPIEVISLANRLKCPLKTRSDTQRVIVLNSPRQPWAILVDYVTQAEQVLAGNVMPFPAVAANPVRSLFEGVLNIGGDLCLLLSPEQIRCDEGPAVKGHRAPQFPPPSRSLLEDATKSSSPGRLLVFSLTRTAANKRPIVLGLSVSQVPEVISPVPLFRVPDAPAFVRGMINWRDNAVPIVDMASCIGFSTESTAERSRLTIARGSRAGSFLGFLTQATARTLRLPLRYNPCVRDLPLDRSMIIGAYELERETLVIPNLNLILNQDWCIPLS